ncbi:hypothetical protein ACFV6V_29085, partial [Streptomyces sp. NPDC059828]
AGPVAAITGGGTTATSTATATSTVRGPSPKPTPKPPDSGWQDHGRPDHGHGRPDQGNRPCKDKGSGPR